MSKIFQAIGRFSVRFRYFIVVGWIVIAWASITFLPSLSSVVHDNNSDFLPKNSPSIAAAKLANQFQNTNDSIIVAVAYRTSGTLNAADNAAVSAISAAVRTVPTVIRSTVAGVSSDQQAVQLEILSSTSAFSQTKTTNLVDAVRAKIATVHLPSDLTVHLAGQLAATVDASKANGNNFNSTQSFSILFILAILLVVFRSLLAPLITLVPALIVAFAGSPIVARLSTALNFKVSSITQLLLIVLVLGAGTDYGLFLVFRVREAVRNGLAPKDAVEYAVTRVGESITFSAFTVIAALLSLITATFGFYKGLGYPLAIAIVLMLLAGLTIQPALLAIAGRAAFWPSKPHKSGPGKVGVWGRVAARVVERPALTLTIGVIVFGALAIASIGNKPSGFTSTSAVPSKSDSALGNAALQKYFKTGSFNPTQLIFKYSAPIWDNLNTVEQLQQHLSKDPAFSQFFGPFNPNLVTLTPAQISQLHSELGSPWKLPPVEPSNLTVPPVLYNSYRSTYQFISPNGTEVLFETTLRAGDPGSTAAIEAIPGIRATVTSAQLHYGALASGVGGEAPAAYDISTASNNDLLHIVPLVVLIIAVLLGIVLRSLVAPLYLVVSVVLSYLAALGIDVLYFMDIKGEAGLSFVLPFMLFLFLLALGEDYNILVMTRIREEAHDLTLREAVKRAMGATGVTVTSAGLVLAGTFFVLGIAGGSGNAQVQEIGIGLGLGIVMDTFLVRTLLVPSTVVLLGKWNWWPSKLHTVHEAREESSAPQEPSAVGSHE
jgi:RND superfamily putative drug exporter